MSAAGSAVSTVSTGRSGAGVVLSTINARYQHASLGLRYLIANSGDLQAEMVIEEFVSGRPVADMAGRLLAHRPRIVALGVYIWNVVETTALVRLLRELAPSVTIVLGGPEVSHEADRQEICRLADFVIQGPGDISFPKLVRAILHGPKPLMPVIAGEQPDLATLALPYRHYTDRDVRERSLYVEASRGCPFKCEFCLSALDKTAWAFPLDRFLAEMAALHARGARRFKFVDRTFNLKPATSVAIMDFFLARIEATPADPCFVHFELVPDHLPQSLKALIARFPPGTLQFEIGIQSFEPTVQALISRRQDNERAEANLRWLGANTHAHLHVDLIAGLPGETLDSFGRGFDRLAAIAPDEIQVGVLKRLRGAPIVRHEHPQGLRFQSQPPYEVTATATMSGQELAAIRLMARFHDLIVNAGRMPRLASLVLGDSPFERLMDVSRNLSTRFGRTHSIALEDLFDGVLDWLRRGARHDDGLLERQALDDYRASGAKGRLSFMKRGLSAGRNPYAPDLHPPPDAPAAPARQVRHLRGPVRDAARAASAIDTARPGVL